MAWKKGPMPAAKDEKGTWGYGGVILHHAGENPAMLGKCGFQFADFKGDHVMILEGPQDNPWVRHDAFEVAMYNNSLNSPTKEELAQ